LALKLIKVGYVPYSRNLAHPGDRRRLGFWADRVGSELEIDAPLSSDILILSSNANLMNWIDKSKIPVILDFIDGYLGENPNFLRDFLRNIIRTFKGTSSLRWITYTNHLKEACKRSNAVIVASVEQKIFVEKYNKNVFIILDNHSEVLVGHKPESNKAQLLPERGSQNRIFWEGFGYTLKHFKVVSDALDIFLLDHDMILTLVTVPEFHRWGGYLGKVKTSDLVKKYFPNSWNRVEIIPWSIENLLDQAKLSRFAIIPIDSQDRFASIKSENKLLSMWMLGLPTVFSDIPSYRRVARITNELRNCIKSDDWKNGLASIYSDTHTNLQVSTDVQIFLAENHGELAILAKWSQAIEETSRMDR